MGKTAETQSLPSPRRKCQVPITVLLALSRTHNFCRLLSRLANEKDIRILGRPVMEEEGLLSCLEQSWPQMLLLDKCLFDRLDAQVARTIHAKFPLLRVLLLCDRVRSGLVGEILRNQFHGFLLPSRSTDTYVNAIRLVSMGELWLPRAMLEQEILKVYARDLWVPKNHAASGK